MRAMRARSVLFVVACLAGAVACVGGSGSLPGQAVGSEEPTSGGSDSRSSTSPSPSSGSGSNAGSNDTAPAVQCTPGASCDCGSPRFVGTQKCDGDKPTCQCTLAADGG